MTRGLSSAGADVGSVGVVPTPAVAYLTKADGFDLGVVISASHNPYRDNGIKVFSGAGEKFTETEERAVEAMVDDGSWSVAGTETPARPRPDLVPHYLDHLRRVLADAGPLRRRTNRRRLRQRRCQRDRAGPVSRPRVRGRGDRRDARRHQHQPRLRIDGHGGVAGPGAGQRRSPRRGLRRRRRPRALRRSPRPAGRRRCRDVHLRRAAAPRGASRRRRASGDGDEQHRPRAGLAGPRAGPHPLPGRRQVRHGGDAEARAVARRRAVGPRDLRRTPLHRRRSGHRTARAAHDGRHRSRARRPGGSAHQPIRRCC